MITEKLLPALQGVFPSGFATKSKEGTPNVSYISQVFYVDDRHVAISNQFFNKSMRNIDENGIATVNVIHPENLDGWYLHLQHRETKTDGVLYDQMKMQLEAIASMSGMENVFKLHAAEIFEVIKIEKVQIS